MCDLHIGNLICYVYFDTGAIGKHYEKNAY